METKDAMVDGWTKPSNMLEIRELPLNKHTHMLPMTKHAKWKEDHTKSQVIPM